MSPGRPGLARRVARFCMQFWWLLPDSPRLLLMRWVRLILVRGRLKADGSEVTLLYVGRLFNEQYLLDTLFSDCEQLHLERVSVLSFRKVLARLEPRADAVVCDLAWPWSNGLRDTGGFLEVPEWVNMQRPLQATWEETVGGIHRNLRQEGLRIVRREGYAPRLTRDRRALADFHARMLVPYVSQRFGDAADVASLLNVQLHGHFSDLLQVLKGDEVVAAGVLLPRGRQLRLLWVGAVLDARGQWAQGAMNALYLFSLRHAFDRGHRVLNLAGTRPLLSDGVYRFKRKWGAVVDDGFTPIGFLFRPRADNAAAIRLCAAMPLMYRQADGLGAVTVSAGTEVNTQELLRLHREQGVPGLVSFTLLGIGNEERDESLPPAPGGCRLRLIVTRPENFARRYIDLGQSA